jgi:hypothetical protein
VVKKLKPALQDSEGRSAPWSGSRLVNAFPEKSDGDKVDDFAIMAVPGLVRFGNVSSLPVRGLHRMGAVLYGVIGVTLYSIASDGSTATLGTIPGTGMTAMADNGAELAIHDGATTGYVYSGGTLTSPAGLPNVSHVAYIDGYFVWTIANGDQFIISGSNDGLSYDPLDVATVEGAPDNLVGVVNSHRELLFPGTDTLEVWYDSGDADFPFARQGNAFIERGCIDRDSLVKLDNSVYFVGDDRIAYRLDGYQPIRVSTHTIEIKLAEASWFRAFTYAQEGHKFYCLNTDVGCFCYDLATQAWAERVSFGRANYRVGCAVTAYGQTIFGDNATGRLYTPDLDVYDEDGDPMPVVIELPTIEAQRERATLYALETYCETGVGNATAPDPQIIMQYSRDGGRSWSNEMSRSLGRVGEYLTRAVWRPTVEFRQLQLRFTLPDKARRLVISYFADVR